MYCVRYHGHFLDGRGLGGRLTQRPVLVTGATSKVGRLVIDELLSAGVPVRALTRRADNAQFPAGTEVVVGDFEDPASLGPALKDVGAVFLVWTAPPTTAADVIERITDRDPGSGRRVVYLSAPFRTPHPFFQQPNPLRDLHAGIERLLAGSLLDVAILRPGMFTSNALHWWAPQIRQGNVVRWVYGAAETAPIDERDIAAVAARVLLDDRHARADFVLTGPDSLSQSAQVQAIGAGIGRSLRFVDLSPEDFRREVAATWPTAVVEMLLDAWKATLGHRAFVTSTVHGVIGRPARTVLQWASDNAAAFDSVDHL